MKVFISVFDKTGLVQFIKGISNHLDEIYSTGGSYKHLKENGIDVRNSSELTGFGEILGGRVKTLHPKVFSGILSNRDQKSREETDSIGAPEFDMVVVNYYPFEKAASSGNLDEMIENIDIGGVSLVRAAAKNYRNVIVLTDPSHYKVVSEELSQMGSISMRTREMLAMRAMARTAEYDVNIYNSLYRKLNNTVPEELFLHYKGKEELRYGENPDQKGYLFSDGSRNGIANAEQLNGKQLSYNNLVDADAAFETALEFDETTAVVVKHNTPCGVSSGNTLAEALRKAIDADSESAYGSVIALNRKVDMATLDEMKKRFIEVLIAPDYDEDALERLRTRKNLRVLKVPFIRDDSLRYKAISNGIVAQTPLRSDFGTPILKTKKEAGKDVMRDMEFAWKVVAHCRSNAIVLAKDRTTVGIGGGQTSRIEAMRIATAKAGEKARGAVLASDAYFPFSDNVELAA
ncbi:MAG TPA: bifunctional phosphoribosylaminoimidazolecarboxamide formyltransferase/IMP cyclohydrolase, partial [Thermoplasmataceae archaeon]|nr:bifunctional phosphoribosylaminoimidazolecarboxamide formyltransferase/IMP cyclohydrolase [Thermoplasmataceae archaeon]